MEGVLIYFVRKGVLSVKVFCRYKYRSRFFFGLGFEDRWKIDDTVRFCRVDDYLILYDKMICALIGDVRGVWGNWGAVVFY